MSLTQFTINKHFLAKMQHLFLEIFRKQEFVLSLLAAGRWRWSLLVVGLMLLVFLTVLAFYFLHDVVKGEFYSFVFFS